jgi:type I restriction enzyme, R subunit
MMQWDTAVTMFNKVQAKWKDELKALQGRINATTNDVERQRLKQLKAWMSQVEMAVIVSEEAGEEEKFAKKKLDIKPHRKRMNEVDEHGHDIEYNFKDPDHPLQLVFVCAMWLTGFDAPTVSTLYLDKPMQGHTLMQTIARANRVSGHEIQGKSKLNGEVVDYYIPRCWCRTGTRTTRPNARCAQKSSACWTKTCPSLTTAQPSSRSAITCMN